MTGRPWFNKLMFALFTVVAVLYAARVHDSMATWVVLVLALNAGVFLERWRRPGELTEDSPPETPVQAE